MVKFKANKRKGQKNVCTDYKNSGEPVIMLTDKSDTSKSPEIIEPVTTLRNDGKFIHIVSKLPGIVEEKIKIDIDIEKTTITIIAENTTKVYKKIISVPGDVVFSNKRFSDGELHLTVEKRRV